MFSQALLTSHKEYGELLAICDSNEARMAYHNKVYEEQYKTSAVRTYHASDFDLMLKKEKPDVVIVVTIDRTHDEYIIRAMEAGCDVITEKPMTTDEKKCNAILEAAAKTGRDIRVAFNYRYSPSRSMVKELIQSGTIGEICSVHFEWLLDTKHGADYFRRWHRDKANSGGMMVHKSTHHFDLVNWWIGSEPELVFGLGQLAFYGKANGQRMGRYHPYYRSTGSAQAEGDPFALDMRGSDKQEGLYLNPEKEDGYLRDQNVFGDGISIEDTMNLLVRYKSGAQMSYSLHNYAPWEGFRIGFNGTKGRIQLDESERSYISSGNGHIEDGVTKSRQLTVFPHWEKPYHVDIAKAVGGHGGGDLLLLDDLFGVREQSDNLGRAAGVRDGAMSILTGIAANKSFATGKPVRVQDLINPQLLM